ncbi:hypothetical protein Tco_0407599 [Tanacetum coccineum]
MLRTPPPWWVCRCEKWFVKYGSRLGHGLYVALVSAGECQSGYKGGHVRRNVESNAIAGVDCLQKLVNTSSE